MGNAILKTPLGFATIQGNENGIHSISILDASENLTEHIPINLQKCAFQLQEYFEGKRQSFDLPLAPQGTEFQKKVWQALLEIPFGKTKSYLELSRKLGDVNAIRAVASANGKNPLWIVIPCHRVIGSDGSLTGYAGGLWRKKWLLEHESPPKQQTLFKFFLSFALSLLV
ncbi:MAG: methylated-DNA--[protein]-cysteine S-methyltransferase [Flavobacteriales bacterium]|nr:methylated-DNA--[protein]-cysteine S-methyltransferase [Flavobacteriales bacterium]